MADLLGIAISGLKTSQSQLSTTGHNITHANDEGYSRQRVSLGTNPALYMGSGYMGAGVNIQSIDRIANEFVISQIRLDTSAFNGLDAFSQKIGQLDSLLANESVGLSSSMSGFFGSLQAATNDPTSIPVRQLVLAQAGVLSQRFDALYGRLTEINNTVNQEINVIAGQISTLATSLATINENITSAMAQANGGAPNDLLDARDEVLRQLSELVSISSVQQGDGAVNVSIGNGQPLVMGNVVTKIIGVAGASDGGRNDVAIAGTNPAQIISNDITGGRLGGLLEFRENVLDRSFNELGRVALTFTDTMNTQQQLGLDLNGNFGVPLFDSINTRQAQLERVAPSRSNALPPDRLVSVAITDPGALSNSDYELRLAGGGPDSYELVRLSDNKVVQAGGLPSQRPTSFETEGFRVTFEAGSFTNGDRFTLMPTRVGANNVNVIASSPEVLAFAQPVSTSTSLSNTGTGKISQGETLQTINPLTGEYLPAFKSPGSLAPPLMVRFTSPTTYDVLDATDPANPKSLNPPMQNLLFRPGETNQILPSQPGQTVVVSNGANAGRIPRLSEVVSGPVGTSAFNTYLSENIAISKTDPRTGIVTSQPVVQVKQGDSAEQIAFQLSSRNGVTATAYTDIKISVNDNGLTTGADFNLYLNGINLSETLALSLGLASPPRPLTNDLIAQAINASGVLQTQGIRAVSDGNMIRVTASSGADLKFQVEGDNSAVALGTVNVSSGIDLTTGGPYSFDIDIFDGPNGSSNPKTIDLNGVFTNSNDLQNYLQNEIDQAYGATGVVKVGVNSDGTLSISTVSNNTDEKIKLSNLQGGDPLGLTAAVTQSAVNPIDTDFIHVKGDDPAIAFGTTNVSGAVNLTTGGPYSFAIDIFDGPNAASNPQTIAVAGVFNNPDDLLSYLQKQIDLAYQVPGKVKVSLNDDGTLALATVSTNTDARIQLSALTGGDPLGLATAVSQGVQTPSDILRLEGVGVAGAVNSATIGGVVNVTLDEGYQLTSTATTAGNVFTSRPPAVSNFLGYTFDIFGNPAGGDEFFVNFNTNGVSDNRNAMKFVGIEAAKLINGNASFQESYGDLVQYVGTVTAETRTNRNAANEILFQSQELRNSVSGVNLDEEAANLIRFEQVYNASSRVVSVARDLFNTLLQSF